MLILKGFLELLNFIARQFADFLKTAITFPILTSDPSNEDRRYSSKSSEEIFGVIIACFAAVIFLVYLTDVLFNLFFVIYDFINLFPSSLSQEPINSVSGDDTMNDFFSIVLSFQFIVEILDLIIKLMIFLTFFIIIIQVLLAIIGILLFLLDLYVLIRRNIAQSSYKKGDHELFNLNDSDISFLLFIGGLLIFPVFSVILISYIVPFLFIFIYNTCFSGINEFYAGTYQIAYNMHQEIISMIVELFSIETPLGRIIRMIIGFFWMLIGLSIFSYDPSLSLNSININISEQLSQFYSNRGNNCSSDSLFIMNIGTAFLLLFDPFISLGVILFLRKALILL
ncbi:MAG: hypothetical protein ACFFAJ_06785 [Candidatus Hodarchaeota archaeon]